MKKKRPDRVDDDVDWEPRLRRFLNSPLAEAASQGLSDRIHVAVHVDEQQFHLGRRKGRLILIRVPAEKPDLHFWVPAGAMRHLLALAELPETGIATMGVAIFEHVFAADKERKIRFRLEAGLLSLWSKGYFSVLKAGGPEVASYLARFGLNGLHAIKEALKKAGAGQR